MESPGREDEALVPLLFSFFQAKMEATKDRTMRQVGSKRFLKCRLTPLSARSYPCANWSGRPGRPCHGPTTRQRLEALGRP